VACFIGPVVDILLASLFGKDQNALNTSVSKSMSTAGLPYLTKVSQAVLWIQVYKKSTPER